MDKASKRKVTFSGAYLVAGLLLAWIYASYLATSATQTVAFTEMVERIRSGEVIQVSISETEVRGVAKPETDGARPRPLVAKRVPSVDGPILATLVQEGRAKVVGEPAEAKWWMQLLYWLPFLLLMFGPYLFGMKMIGKAGGPLSLGRSRAKIYDSSTQDSEGVRFSDVAGIDEAKDELVEVVDYLKNPKRYAHLGAKIPKGVLLVGPPGTGKTLLARAVAGEAGVPFFSISGSEFVEMFVGVGAARVRELFSQATEKAPCIIFIDEIDAIGRSRGGHGAFGTHEEREQTLNQLLTEMDGFDSSKGVVILAATNRPEVLDQALVRSGRFDRQVVVDAPDVTGRKAILEVHTRKVPLAEDVDLQTVAKRTPGMVGADLAKVVNEAALAAARRGIQQVAQKDFEEAIDRIQLGLKRKGRAMSDTEKERVAYHESGHTIVAMSVERADPVHRVTIIPRSIGALGATLQLPSEDRYLVTQKELEDRICVMLGGRAAEDLVFNEVSTGAQNDIERATETARQMICRFGMSEKLGPQTFGQPVGLRFLDTPASLGGQRNFSEARAQEIDAEVDSIVREQYQRARTLLQERRSILRAMSLELLERETLERADLERLVNGKPAAQSLEAAQAS